jgi:hypothetical protein
MTTVPSSCLLRAHSRVHAHENAVVFGGKQMQQSIRTLSHIADPLLQFPQHRFAVEFCPLLRSIARDDPNPGLLSAAFHRRRPVAPVEVILEIAMDGWPVAPGRSEFGQATLVGES